ncbi:MAG: hypothetical protein A3B30_03170 [Candidatus Komeilibacteria bacterium RIFCSPLOWO2_01_FULL_52_15]|uniref:Uncharacterized protein n=2 Tax=Candidatus Komeiliibacteriota TaxID=1817908 RepID=A0A1G2BMT9_9BACT|nr:MAG: hypothetical protein A2677_03605 [Candidatus Komeilibacteria bacterium RIFCSPHIGHO2_01_FULL_52_14]OGY90452.1 MAG: hypothetical protein A3B30_03170 [Candidatus Komeilibacteria bacterium RIFCSPLOWO2_01_FULL_52_15]
MTVEDLALIIQNDVVAHMATKDDIARLEQRLDEHGRRLDHVEAHLADLRSGFRNLNITQNRLVTTLAGKRILTMDEARGLSAA